MILVNKEDMVLHAIYGENPRGSDVVKGELGVCQLLNISHENVINCMFIDQVKSFRQAYLVMSPSMA